MRGLAALLLVFISSAASADPIRVDQLAWLAGCWGFDTPDGRYEEQWMKPTGNSVLGMSRRVGDGYTREFEYMRIVTSGGGGFDFIAIEAEGEAKRFNMLTLQGTKITFENTDYQFPRKIIYEYAAPDSLNVRIEGLNQGRPMGLNFPMKRKTCP